MLNSDQISALCNGLVDDARILSDKVGALHAEMAAIENDGTLTESGKALKLEPIKAEAAKIVDPLRADIAKREVTLAAEESAWDSPIGAMLQFEPPTPWSAIKDDEQGKRLRAIERHAEISSFAQKISIATPQMKQLLLDGAVAASRWDLAALALISRTDADTKGGFRGISDDEVRSRFPIWRDGRSKLAMARVALEEARMKMAQSEGYNPVRDLKAGHKIDAARRAAGIAPTQDSYDPGPGLVARVKKGGM